VGVSLTIESIFYATVGELDLLVGFETEACSGATGHAEALIDEYRPDYIVGSVHHVDDFPIDYNADAYRQAVSQNGGRYFDIQYDLINRLCPSVVAYFDLIRLFDPYPKMDKVGNPGYGWQNNQSG